MVPPIDPARPDALLDEHAQSSALRGALTVSRRKMIATSGALAAGAGALEMLRPLASAPLRLAPLSSTPSDIQFDIGNFINAPQTVNDGGGNVTIQLPPVFTAFATATLSGRPNKTDQAVLAEALHDIEEAYAFSPSGAFTFVSYGLPYFNRFPSALTGAKIPKLASDNTRSALEEAVPGPTDVSSANPNITKQTFNVPVTIEKNDLLFTVRSDNSAHITDILNFLNGSNSLNGQFTFSPKFSVKMTFTSTRMMFMQIGLPRKTADNNNLSFADEVNPDSTMWMGFLDQQTDGSGPAQIVTFQGNSSAVLTTAKSGDYFDNGSIQHLSHDIQDLAQFYARPTASDPGEPFTERVQYMFRSDPIPSTGNSDQFTNGGGPAYFDNVFQGTGDAQNNAAAVNTFEGQHRMGHLAGLQRSSRASDGTPIHVRNDGPGFDSLDVPDGSKQPKLQFTVFVPTAEFFRVMRVNQASLDLVQQFGVADDDNGLERFLTATRRQNYLIPPRRHRAFPLTEFL